MGICTQYREMIIDILDYPRMAQAYNDDTALLGESVRDLVVETTDRRQIITQQLRINK